MDKNEIAKEVVQKHIDSINWDEGDMILLEKNIVEALDSYAQQQVKKSVDLGGVSQQRELLLAFIKQVKVHNEIADTINECDVDAFLQANNCA